MEMTLTGKMNAMLAPLIGTSFSAESIESRFARQRESGVRRSGRGDPQEKPIS